MMHTYRKQNIQLLAQAIEGDQFCDAQQYEQAREQADSRILPMLVDFVNRNLTDLPQGKLLEAGCGSGLLLKDIPGINYLMDPSKAMLQRADALVAQLGLTHVQLLNGVTEYIDLESNTLRAVIFLNGFFQVRSDYESLIEINRVLTMGGRFIFNILCDDSNDIICGKVHGLKNYVRTCREFGFEVVEQRRVGEHGLICIEKVAAFAPEMLRKLQLVPAQPPEHERQLNVKYEGYKLLNFYAPRDGKLL